LKGYRFPGDLFSVIGYSWSNFRGIYKNMPWRCQSEQSFQAMDLRCAWYKMQDFNREIQSFGK
jgi:hypothetical protein